MSLIMLRFINDNIDRLKDRIIRDNKKRKELYEKLLKTDPVKASEVMIREIKIIKEESKGNETLLGFNSEDINQIKIIINNDNEYRAKSRERERKKRGVKNPRKPTIKDIVILDQIDHEIPSVREATPINNCAAPFLFGEKDSGLEWPFILLSDESLKNNIPNQKDEEMTSSCAKEMSASYAIPTIGLRGIQFRSIAEAKWAYFFDKLGISWDYEPITLNGYIPDFILEGLILVEIKGGELDLKNLDNYAAKIKKSGWNKTFYICGAKLFGNVIGRKFEYKGFDCWKSSDEVVNDPNIEKYWIEACNSTQWKGKQNDNKS